MRRISVLAAGAALVAAMPAFAQDWATLRDALLDQAGRLFAEEGYHAVGFVHEGALDNGEAARVTLPLREGGEIVLVGVCDGDCSDMDLTLFDPGGTQLAADIETDDVPIVRTTPGRTGAYSVTVQMAACSVDPCGFALQAFFK